MNRTEYLVFLIIILSVSCSKESSPYAPTQKISNIPSGYSLIWSDEFNYEGQPDEQNWSFENGFVRNNELQWYQAQNAHVSKGVLVITGKKETIKNSNFEEGSNDWRKNRKYADYSSSSLNTLGKQHFKYGIFEVRARIDTAMGLWPAIWTLGTSKVWPKNGEIDIMEFYRINDKPMILANAAWEKFGWEANWDSQHIFLQEFLELDKNWVSKFHIWKMEWDSLAVNLYLDNQLLNKIDISQTLNKDGFNPFKQSHFILLNLAIGSNGGNPEKTDFPRIYEVDYVRVFQKTN